MNKTLAESRLEELVTRLEAGLQLARSLDGMLIVMESELLVIREEAERQGVDASELLRRALSSTRLRGYLEKLKCCEGELMALLDTPRFKGLRRHRAVLEELLSTVECVGDGELECGVPQPAWAKEHAPVGRGPEDTAPWGAHAVPVKVVRRGIISRLAPRSLSRGDLIAYGFLALLLLLNALILLFR